MIKKLDLLATHAYGFDPREVIQGKINELVDAVNKLSEHHHEVKVDGMTRETTLPLTDLKF